MTSPKANEPSTCEDKTFARTSTSASGESSSAAAQKATVDAAAFIAGSSADLSTADAPTAEAPTGEATEIHNLAYLMQQGRRVEVLRQLDCFRDLGTAELSELAKEVEEVEYDANVTLIRSGDVGDRMYILIEGELIVLLHNEERSHAYTVTLTSGQIFGEMALLTGEPRIADVHTQSPCSCLMLKKKTVFDLIQRQPQIARFLTSILGQRLMRAGQIQQVGKYRLLGRLGKGGMSYVFEGVHPILERTVAVKMLSHELVYSADFIEQFKREARIMAKLRHPNIVEVFDTEEAYATFFIIMEKLTGIDLHQELKRRGRFGQEETRTVIKQIASALDTAHKHGIIHRDIKPSNIMLASDGSVKLTDFGIALSRPPNRMAQQESGAVQGTPNYMAPEQVQGKALDGRADIYALGIVAYRMLTGTRPFRGQVREVMIKHIKEPLPNIRQYLPDIDDDLEAFVRKATAKDPDHRFPNGQAILDMFGDTTQPSPLQELEVQTLTFAYHPKHQATIQALVEHCHQQTAHLAEVIVKS